MPIAFAPDRFVVRAYCAACSHSARLPAACLEVPPEELRRRLRCRQCRAKQAGIRIVYVGAGGFRYGAHRSGD